MTETSTTYYTPEVTAAVVAHGLMALGMHMAENNLPLYIGIDTPDAIRGRNQSIEVHLHAGTIGAWLDSIELDDTEVEAREGDHRYPWKLHHFGRLPNSGVRVDLYQLLDRAPLEAVQS